MKFFRSSVMRAKCWSSCSAVKKHNQSHGLFESGMMRLGRNLGLGQSIQPTDKSHATTPERRLHFAYRLGIVISSFPSAYTVDFPNA